MKKVFNILLFTVTVIASSLLLSTVKAENFALYYECDYDKTLLNIKTPTESMKIYYTDIKTDSDETAFFSELKDSNISDGRLYRAIQTDIIPLISFDGRAEDNFENSFISVKGQNDSCPKYIEIMKTREKYYTAQFINELTVCKDNSENCGGYYTLKNHIEYNIEPTDVIWRVVETGKTVGNLSKADFYVDDQYMKLSYQAFGQFSNAFNYANYDTSETVMVVPVITRTKFNATSYIYYGMDRLKKIAQTLDYTGKSGTTDIECSMKPGTDASTKMNASFMWAFEQKNTRSQNFYFPYPSSLCNASDLTDITKEVETALGKVNLASSQASSKNGLIDYNSDGTSASKRDFSNYTCSQLQAKVDFYNQNMNRYRSFTDKSDDLFFDYERILNELSDSQIKLSNYSGCSSVKQQYSEKIENAIKRLEIIISATNDAINDIKYQSEQKECNINFQRADKAVAASEEAILTAYAKLALSLRSFNITSGCAILGGDLIKFLNSILWYVRLFAIVLAVILSLLDYIKAAAGSDDKPMAAANKRFMTRLILIIVLFLLPVLLQTVLNIVNVNGVSGASIDCLK